MLIIRLQRIGKRKQPTYRMIVSEKSRDTQFGHLEVVGLYNPIQVPKIIDLKADRIKYWISVGAQMSATVNNLLVTQGIIEGKKQKSVAISKKRKEKIEKKASDAKAEADKRAADEVKRKEAEAAAAAEAKAKAEESAAAKAAEEAAATAAKEALVAEEKAPEAATTPEATPAPEEDSAKPESAPEQNT